MKNRGRRGEDSIRRVANILNIANTAVSTDHGLRHRAKMMSTYIRCGVGSVRAALDRRTRVEHDFSFKSPRCVSSLFYSLSALVALTRKKTINCPEHVCRPTLRLLRLLRLRPNRRSDAFAAFFSADNSRREARNNREAIPLYSTSTRTRFPAATWETKCVPTSASMSL